MTGEDLAKACYETYRERMNREGHSPIIETKWEDAPEESRLLMIDVAEDVLKDLLGRIRRHERREDALILESKTLRQEVRDLKAK